MPTATEFIHEHEERLLNELKDFLRIPSISTLPEHAGDVQRAAHFVAEKLTAAGIPLPASRRIA